MIKLKPRSWGASMYGYFNKPHFKLHKKIPMDMTFIDKKGFVYRYHADEKIYHCYANCSLTLVE